MENRISSPKIGLGWISNVGEEVIDVLISILLLTPEKSEEKLTVPRFEIDELLVLLGRGESPSNSSSR